MTPSRPGLRLSPGRAGVDEVEHDRATASPSRSASRRRRARPRSRAARGRPSREELQTRSRGARSSRYPEQPLGLDPGPLGGPAPLRLVHPGGDPPGGRGDAGHPRLPGVGRQLLRPLRTSSRPATTRSSSAPTSPAGCAAATSCSTPSARRPAPTARRPATAAPSRRTARSRVRLRVPRRLRPRADGLDRRALLRPAGRRPTPRRSSSSCAPATRCCPEKALAKRGRWPAASPSRATPDERVRTGEGAATGECERNQACCSRHAEDPTLAHDRGLPSAYGGYAGPRRRPSREIEPDEMLNELEDSGLRGRGGAGFSMGKKASFLPRGDMAKYLCCNADESEPGAFKDRELMQQEPPPADRGDHRSPRSPPAPATPSSSSAASTTCRATSSTRAVDEAYDAGYLGNDILGIRLRPRAGRPPRRRRLHLRRGDRAARRARGQARQPAPEAALPGGPGPLRRADPDQQRRDALQRAPHRRQRRRLVQELRHRAVARHQGRLGLRLRASGPATTRSSWGSPRRDLIYGLAGGPVDGREIKAFYPGGSSSPVLTPEELDLPYSFEAMAEAGSMLGSGSIIVADDSVSIPQHGAADGEVLPPRVVRQVHPLPRGHQLDREDARAGRPRRGDADGPRHHLLGPEEHHRPLPLRARRLDGDAGRLDGPQVPRRVRARSSKSGAWPGLARTRTRPASRSSRSTRPQAGRAPAGGGS